MEYKSLANRTSDFPEDQLPLFTSGMDTLVTQFMDFNEDGAPEEILVQTSLAANETQVVRVDFIEAGNYPEFPQKTNIRFAGHQDYRKEFDTATRVQSTETAVTSGVYQMEGPAWENDKVGFRNYFDLRNGIDIFGKRTPEMVLDEVGRQDKDEDYHSLNPWGMDVLKVGNSLGAGSLALMKGDRLYRVGDHGDGRYEFLYEGPLRSEFRFRFPDWKAEGEVYDLTHYISITAGDYAYRSSVYLSGNPGEVELISGIVNLHSEALMNLEEEGYHVLLTHDRQAEDGAMLAMALVIPDEFYLGADSTARKGAGISDTYYARMNLGGDEGTRFWFYAFWETTDPAFAETEKVLEVIREDIRKRENPVLIKR
jgi:hypothetical protein